MANDNITPDAEKIQAQAVSTKDKLLITTIIIILAIIAGLAVIGFIFLKQGPDTIQGQGDATEIRISGKLPGRVADIYVEEGQQVHAGDTLVHIRSSLVDAKMEQADAMQQVATAADKKVDAGTRIEIVQSAYEVMRQADAAVGITQKTFERLDNLYKEGVISEQKRDEAKAAYDAAVAGRDAAKSQYELAKAGAQREDKEAAAAMVKASKASVKEVNAILEDQYLTAPCDGIITVIYPNVSELISLGTPIMTLQKDDHWAVFNLRETSLKNIKEGSTLKVYIPALDLNTEMTVFYIKDLGTYANWQATKSTGDFDARTFQVKARPKKPIENFRPGMSVVLKQ
ncbi:MAG: HlyD family efflux transporter periplasmic adaptor subunit [Prevotella sp.]|nr:HlyD family efflux transporter periplasmic adaptor subunit [Bacteroides sp.]MCM1365752.1 HlyD family efflux transporter periplasmic adaptor subunit [Prevotella sp.]MCM1436422.1 HlyD family efflux transporter periplasmic adaptor subunit [Prevotella sp.]